MARGPGARGPVGGRPGGGGERRRAARRGGGGRGGGAGGGGGGVCWLGGRELGARWVASQEAESTTSDFKGRCLDTHFCPLPPPPRR